MTTMAVFTYHSSQQLKDRHDLTIPYNRPIDIEQGFVKALRYEHPENGDCSAWVFKDLSRKIMLILSHKSKVVITTYGGKDFDENRKMFVEAYQNVATHPEIIKANAPYKK